LIFDQTLSALAWTPDGKYLLASGGRNVGDPSAIHVITVESGDLRTIITADGMDGFYPIALSPDGRTLAAVRNRSGAEHATQLFHLTPEWTVDGPPIDAPIAGDVLTITWSADSRELIYRPGVNTQVPLYRVAVPDGVPAPMAWVGADAQSATISGAAKRLVYTRFVRDTNIWRIAVDSAETGAPVLEQLPSSSFRDVFPQYSPDGKRLVFYSNRSGSIQIWTSTADGNSTNQLTTMDPRATTGSPRWSPDGRRIVFDSNAGGRYQLYEVSADGGPARAIVTDASNNFTGAWSPDGKWLYFSSDRSGRLEVWRQPGGGGAAEQVSKNGGSSPTVSPDGAWVYFVKDDGAKGLWRMAISGGEESMMIDTTFRYAYVATPSAIYYMVRGVPNVPGVLRKLDLATRRTKDLLVLDKLPDLGLAMSPDSRYLLFCKIDYAGADLMLVENFR
jgi:Tol biopolymer transport system component